ncbi:hypothetical protein OKW26_002969 [Paraburkholderia sp. 32]
MRPAQAPDPEAVVAAAKQWGKGQSFEAGLNAMPGALRPWLTRSAPRQLVTRVDPSGCGAPRQRDQENPGLRGARLKAPMIQP